uniref:Uncharacterized protein n=1 Tax=Parascaris equorum TaxID=6256 RepID=A0A914RY44_PAREQ
MTEEDIEGAKSIKSEGVRLANDLQKKILEHNDKAPPTATRTSTNLRRQRRVSPPSTDSGFFTDFSSEGSPSINRSFSRTESTSASGTDQSIDDLLAQLNLRQVAKFEPIFPTVENDDSDDDDSAVTVDEHRLVTESQKIMAGLTNLDNGALTSCQLVASSDAHTSVRLFHRIPTLSPIATTS